MNKDELKDKFMGDDDCPKCEMRVNTKEKLVSVATSSKYGHNQGFVWKTCCCSCGLILEKHGKKK